MQSPCLPADNLRMRAASSHLQRLAFFALVLTILHPSAARAEGGAFGAGIRFSFVPGRVDEEPTQRYFGGQMRLRMSPRTALELSLDYRNALNDTLDLRVKDYPIQVSGLFYLVRSRLAPYLIGGLGWYARSVDDPDGESVLDSVTTRRFGYHAGLGGEIQLGARAAIHLDYRYTFIHFGGDIEEGQGGAVPIPGLGGVQEKLKLSHEGSMWTTGLTFYF